MTKLRISAYLPTHSLGWLEYATKVPVAIKSSYDVNHTFISTVDKELFTCPHLLLKLLTLAKPMSSLLKDLRVGSLIWLNMGTFETPKFAVMADSS